MASIPTEKLCIKCKQTLPVGLFHRDNRRDDGLFPYCKRCRSPDKELWDERIANAGLKRCSECQQWKGQEAFYSSRSRYDGLHTQCRVCSLRSVHQYHAQDPQRNREKKRQRWQQHGEEDRAYYRKWLATPAGKASTARRGNRRKRHVEGAVCDLTAEEWEEIICAQDGKCLACGRLFDVTLKATRDHIIPVSQGGGLTRSNVQALCRGCNSRKRDRVIDYRGKKK